MPVLYSFFPAPPGHAHCQTDLIMGSHYTDRFLEPSAATRHSLAEGDHHHDHHQGHGGQDRTDDSLAPGTSDFGGSSS
jgi:cobalt-zinc-cadmium resistance protein CzcA